MSGYRHGSECGIWAPDLLRDGHAAQPDQQPDKDRQRTSVIGDSEENREWGLHGRHPRRTVTANRAARPAAPPGRCHRHRREHLAPQGRV